MASSDGTSTTTDPSAGRPPELSNQAIATLVPELFPFRALEEVSVKQLPSYDDRNYYFRGTLEHDLGCGEEFVLKVINSTIPHEVIEGQNGILNYLKGKGFKVPYPQPSRKGREMEVLSESQLTKVERDRQETCEEVMFNVRVMTFIPGDLMDKIEKRFLTPRLLYDIGRYIGSIDAALQGFRHPAIDSRVYLSWDLKHLLHLKRYLPVFEDPRKKKMAETVLKMFEEHVFPKVPSLKQGTVYGDPNGLNLVVRMKNSAEYELAGIIDFGDSVNTCYIFELGMMMAYVMIENADPINFASPMLCGFLNAFPTSEEELDLLYYTTLGRLCQSAMNGERQFKQEPWNTYLMTTPVKAWRVMEEMLRVGKDEVDRIWRDARKKCVEDF